MRGEELTQALAQWLLERNIPALAGWSGEERTPLTVPTVIVTLGEYAAREGGFAHYLGERFDEDTASWQECYGRRVELTVSLDLYAPETGEEGELQALLEKLVGALTLEKPLGLPFAQVSCGQTQWDKAQRRLHRRVEGQCPLWLVAVQGAEEEFLDFELRGGWKI